MADTSSNREVRNEITYKFLYFILCKTFNKNTFNNFLPRHFREVILKLNNSSSKKLVISALKRSFIINNIPLKVCLYKTNLLKLGRLEYHYQQTEHSVVSTDDLSSNGCFNKFISNIFNYSFFWVLFYLQFKFTCQFNILYILISHFTMPNIQMPELFFISLASRKKMRSFSHVSRPFLFQNVSSCKKFHCTKIRR
jgi:hypothetical protein